jgi:hypothetical protein
LWESFCSNSPKETYTFSNFKYFKFILYFRIDLNDSSCSHLFRHASEITRETKGGYLLGRIALPEVLTRGGSAYLRICLAPSEVDEDNNAFHLHPNLLHINMRTNKKARKVPVSFKFFLKASITLAFWVCVLL